MGSKDARKAGKKELHGNHARIDPSKKVTPRFLTNLITQNTTDENGNVHIVDETDVEIAKQEVDANHK